MFRDRTNLFYSYRRTFPHSARFPTSSKGALDDEEAFPMMDLSVEGRDLTSGDDSSLAFVSLGQKIDQYIAETNSIMVQLNKLYRKNSLPGFQDTSHDEKDIEELSYTVTQLFGKCYTVMKTLETICKEQTYQDRRLHKSELLVLDNMTKKYALLIQRESNKFRVLQNKYLKFLNKDDLKPITIKSTDQSNLLLLEEEEIEDGMSSRQAEDYSRKTLARQQQRQQDFFQERDEEIKQLAKGVIEVSTIFKEMQALIIDQGTVVDRIDYNLENTVIELKQTDRELRQATRYQKRTQKCKIILLLSLCVFALFLFVMLKPHSTSYKETHTITHAEPAMENSDPIRTDEPEKDASSIKDVSSI